MAFQPADAPDSPLEGTGFELPVPREIDSGLRPRKLTRATPLALLEVRAIEGFGDLGSTRGKSEALGGLPHAPVIVRHLGVIGFIAQAC